MSSISKILLSIWLLLFSVGASAQPGQEHFGIVWVQGQAITYKTIFANYGQPNNEILNPRSSQYFTGGCSNICDSTGAILLLCDGYNLYDSALNLIDGGQALAPTRIIRFNGGFNAYSQGSIILPFSKGRYRVITPTVSDDTCRYNWERTGNGAYCDLLLYSEVDMNLNGGKGKVTKRMVPLLENARLSKTRMMACRHGDGKSWWLFKQAADTNLIYKFLFTQDTVFGPYVQGFGGEAAHFGEWDIDGQSMFSRDGSMYASTQIGYGKVFTADFDRCSGILSNPQVYKVPAQRTGNPSDTSQLDNATNGLSFSPSGQYLYVSGDYSIQQLDLRSTIPALRWAYLFGIDTAWDQFQLYSSIYPGPNGKLYIGHWNGLGGEMSVIDSPDNKSSSTNFCRKCLRFPGYIYNGETRFAGVGTPPCMPNYALGPSNPICYPTGINAPEVKAPAFTLYPNPARELVSVRCGAPGTLQVFDMMGRAVSSMWINRTGIDIHIDISSYAPGIYQCRFTDTRGHQKVVRLLVE